MQNSTPKNILFLISGSIACYKAVEVLAQLIKKNHRVKVVCTASAFNFIGSATLEGLTGNKVYTNTFESGSMMAHIDLARWADGFVLCPATANSINRLAQALGDDLISTIALAKDEHKPFLIFPAMNTEMYNHIGTKEALEKLESWGYITFPTGEGTLACGEQGFGRLLEPVEIVSHIEKELNKEKVESSSRLKIIITSGATKEAIDGIRYISNFSRGLTGSLIADHFISKGYDITYIHGDGSVLPKRVCKKIKFYDFENLDFILKTELGKRRVDGILHLAAVSDYSVDKILKDGEILEKEDLNKISSGGNINIFLKSTHKIIGKLRNYSKNQNIFITAFKLTNTNSESEVFQSVEKIFFQSSPDFVVHNDLNDIIRNNRIFKLFNPSMNSVLCKNIFELNLILDKKIKNYKRNQTTHIRLVDL